MEENNKEDESGCQEKGCLKIKQVMVSLQVATLALLLWVLISIANM